MNPDQPESHPILRTGGCHCGAVRFEANLDVSSPVSRCNCTLCVMRVVSGARLKPSAFRLLSGEDRLGDYSWGAKSSRSTSTACTTSIRHRYGPSIGTAATTTGTPVPATTPGPCTPKRCRPAALS
jgi:hypothetical protein